MDEIQKVVRRDFVVRHQPRKRGGVRVEVILLYAPRLHPIAVQKIGDEAAPAPVDLYEDIGLGRSEGVGAVEYQRIDMVELERGGSARDGGRLAACRARRQRTEQSTGG